MQNKPLVNPHRVFQLQMVATGKLGEATLPEFPKSLIEEDYTTWSIEKFCRLIARWREDAHMAGTHDAYVAYKAMLESAEAAFKQLHPRAYQNFEKRFHEQFQ